MNSHSPQAELALLCLDQGNSRLRALLRGVAGGRQAIALSMDPAAWEAELAPLLARAERVALCSVAPGRSAPLLEWLRPRGKPIFVASGESATPFPVDVRGRRSLGPDRLCNAAAAWADGLAPAIVIDAGTAMTVDFVDRDGRYAGGAILPGSELSLRALAAGGEMLPALALGEWPESPVGRDTESAMLAGALWGLLAAAEGLVARLGGEGCSVILTGGMAGQLGERWRGEVRVEREWTLLGLAALADFAGGVEK